MRTGLTSIAATFFVILEAMAERLFTSPLEPRVVKEFSDESKNLLTPSTNGVKLPNAATEEGRFNLLHFNDQRVLRRVHKKSEVAAQANGAAKPKKAPTEYLTVEMEDGSKDQFVIGKNGPKKMNKYYDLNENGTFKHARFNFVNGRVLTVVPPASLHGQFLGHGVIQKYGDELAGLKPAEGQSEVDPDDMYLTLEELNENIQQGKWSTRAAGDGLGGTSLLIQALMELRWQATRGNQGLLEGQRQDLQGQTEA